MSGVVVTGPLRARRTELTHALEHLIFGVFPVLGTLAELAYQLKINGVAADFAVAYWPAVNRLIHGASPYAVTHYQLLRGWAFVYPAPAAVAFAPFALVSNVAGQVIWTLILIACVPAILYTLQIRDWRVYGLVMFWAPVFAAWDIGNLSLPLTLAVALAWRHRDRPVVAGVVTAAAISLKPFVWPLAVWLLVTRRWRAAGWALASGLVINLLSWWIVGFGQIHAYLRLSSADARALWRDGYSVMAVAHRIGLGHSAAEVLLVALSAAALAGVVYTGLIKRRERDALILAVLVMLLASPLLWSHYFALLLVPVALARPRLSLVWALGLLTWGMPPRQPVHLWEEAVMWAVAAVCVGIALNAHLGVSGRRRERPAGVG